MFERMVQLAEALPEVGSNGGGTRGYPVSVWHGDDTSEYVVDYNEDGTADRVQRVGSTDTWHA